MCLKYLMIFPAFILITCFAYGAPGKDMSSMYESALFAKFFEAEFSAETWHLDLFSEEASEKGETQNKISDFTKRILAQKTGGKLVEAKYLEDIAKNERGPLADWAAYFHYVNYASDAVIMERFKVSYGPMFHLCEFGGDHFEKVIIQFITQEISNPNLDRGVETTTTALLLSLHYLMLEDGVSKGLQNVYFSQGLTFFKGSKVNPHMFATITLMANKTLEQNVFREMVKELFHADMSDHVMELYKQTKRQDFKFIIEGVHQQYLKDLASKQKKIENLKFK